MSEAKHDLLPVFDPRVDRDWNHDNAALVIPCQPATKVMWNEFGQVVLQQEDVFGDDDPYVVFSRESIPSLISHLQKMTEK